MHVCIAILLYEQHRFRRRMSSAINDLHKKKAVRRFKLKNKKMKKLCNANVSVDKYVFSLLSITQR